MTNNFILTKPFDIQKFLNSPKCTGIWARSSDKAGCLLTAFLRGFNMEPVIRWSGGSDATNDVYWEVNGSRMYPTHVRTLVNEAYLSLVGEVDKLHLEYRYPNGVTYTSTHTSPSSQIIALYDKGRFDEALDILFRLIDVLPYKVQNNDKEVRLEVCKQLQNL